MSDPNLNPWGTSSNPAIVPTPEPEAPLSSETPVADVEPVAAVEVEAEVHVEAQIEAEVTTEPQTTATTDAPVPDEPVQAEPVETKVFEASEAAQSNAQVVEAEATDDFDDFGGFSTDQTSAAVSSSNPVPASSSEAEVVGDRVMRVLSSLLANQHQAAKLLSLQFSNALAQSVPLPPLPTPEFDGSLLVALDDPLVPAEKQVFVPNTQFQDKEWYATWKSVAIDQTYSDNVIHNFRWKKSHMRSELLKAMDMNEEALLADITVSADAAAPVASGPASTDPQATAIAQTAAPANPADQKQFDIDEAKKLCLVTEDDIRKMSTAELTTLLQSLAAAQVKMQEQSNHWLDAKEQLLMDAEMHNKMISSLVQYATQAKSSPRSTGKGFFGGGAKKKK
ncbi:hypothetical protein HDU79_006996 [Rhizoclosmatium sp. JEL0117]|nr:hypothetical protein HDU79_006996 [Rhizoclosmatium sp. JEL0117]